MFMFTSHRFVLLSVLVAKLKLSQLFFLLQKEKFHTHLAVLYLEKVLSMLSGLPTGKEQLAKAREKLQAFLRESSSYRVHFILGETNLLGWWLYDYLQQKYKHHCVKTNNLKNASYDLFAFI